LGENEEYSLILLVDFAGFGKGRGRKIPFLDCRFHETALIILSCITRNQLQLQAKRKNQHWEN
jgi:hypothetical protein